MGIEMNTSQPVEATPEDVDALLEAARYDDIEDVVSLYSAGVSLDSKDSDGRTGSPGSQYPFMYMLLKAFNFIHGSATLHMSAANGHRGIVEYLIQNGVDVNASNSEKNTPLHWACLNGHIEVVKTLILQGASVSALNSHERTPVDEAVIRGKMEVLDAVSTAVALLELAGVTVS